MEYFNHLPEELTLGILSLVPTESLLECKLVCKNWRNLVSETPSLSRMHIKHHLDSSDADSGMLGFIALTYSDKNEYNFQYFEYNENYEPTAPPIDRIRRINFNPPFGEDTMFMGSCNGLICLSGLYPEKSTYICNPITRDYIMLPEFNKRAKYCSIAIGMGYVTSTNEYKVVKIMSDHCTERMEVYIYTLGSGLGWRNLGNFDFGTIVPYWGKGIFVNGALYWLGSGLKMIFTFNLSEENFYEHLSPPVQPEANDCYQLGVLDGCLSFVIDHTYMDGNDCWNVWLLKKKNDNHSLEWDKVFSVYDSGFLFAVTKSNAVLTYSLKDINIHDLQASTSERIVDFKEYFSRVFPHKNTLVSLKELGEEDTKKMESVEIVQPFQLAVGG